MFSYEYQRKMSIDFLGEGLAEKMQGIILEINKISRHIYLLVNRFQILLGYIVRSTKNT